MKSCLAAIVLVGICLGIASANQLLIRDVPPRRTTALGTRTAPQPRRVVPVAAVSNRKPWIPAGKLGLVLDDGTRVIGELPKNSPLDLKTRVGRIVVPHNELVRVVPSGNRFQVLLKNGDRITGTLPTGRLLFETQHGPLTVAAKSLVSLTTGPTESLKSLLTQLKGRWQVTYTNRTQQVREVDENGLVNGRDEIIQKGRDLLIVFPTVIERITLVDGRLFVEHFKPRSNYPHGIPTVMGVGRRVDAE